MIKPLFGNLFDLDGDGQATFEEELIGLHIMDEINKTDYSEDLSDDLNSFDELDDDNDFNE